ncbi:MAG: response regulator, partial [Anaerolineales bacterium]|nr:response regulator [Anaerolineales bacterium]
RRNAALLLVIPILSTLFAIFNEPLQLIWVSEYVGPAPIYDVRSVGFGGWSFVHVAWVYLVTIASVYLLLQAMGRAPEVYRAQVRALVLAMVLPILAGYLNVPMPDLPVRLIPVAISLGGLLVVWSFMRYRLLELTPIARDVILENMQDGVIVLDAENRVLDVNQTAVSFLNASPRKLVGQPIDQLVDSWARLAGRLAQPDRQGRLMVNGRSFDVTAVQLRNQAQEAIGAILTLRDTTQQRLLEEEFRQAQKMEALGLLTGGVAHDLNNVLTVIRSYTDLLLHERTGLEMRPRRYAEAVKKASLQASELVQQLLSFSRKQVWEPRLVSLNEVVDDVVQMVTRLIGEQIKIETVLVRDPRLVEADPNQLRQLILNLAINARDAMPQGGTLTLRTQHHRAVDGMPTMNGRLAPGEYAVLMVEDTGIGMDELLLQRIFEPFFTTKGVGQGTGLGLAIVTGVVAQAEGGIVVESQPGSGTKFIIYLPVAGGEEETAVAATDDSRKWATGSETILLAEDEESVLELVEEVLEEQGYQLLTAKDAMGAITLSDAYPGTIDLLLTDVIMPGMNGRELAESLRASRPDIKILYMSGYTRDVLAQNLNLDRPVRLLRKPFTPEELINSVRDVLDDETLAHP